MATSRSSALAVSPPPTAPPAAATALLDAAERLFIERGVERVGLADIAAAAGVPPRAARGHYATREQLLQAMQDRFVSDYCAHLDAAMARCPPGDWSARLRTFVCTGVDGYLDHVALHDVVFHDQRSHDRQAWQDNPVIERLVVLLEGGIAARVWVAPDPRLTAVIFFTAMHSAVDRVIASGEPADRQRLSQTLIGYFERSVQWWTRF